MGSKPPPALRRHVRGQWIVRWGGRTHYFGSDRPVAERLFLDPDSAHPGCLREWASWKSRHEPRRPRRRERLRVVALVRLFLESYEAEGRPQTSRYFSRHLRRFLHVYGRLFADELDAAALNALKRDLHALRLAPKTIAHDINACKTLLRWGHENHPSQVPAIMLRSVRTPALPPPMPEPLTPAQTREFIRRCAAADTRLEPWLALNYLCFARPSEIVRLVAGEGVWVPLPGPDGRPVERGLFRLRESKMQRRTSVPRHLVLTEEALMWLEVARPHWSRLDSYSAAVSRALGDRASRAAWLPTGPRVLRDSAATHLHLLGEARGTVDLLLGHMPSRVSMTYTPIAWHALRASAARLTLR